MKSFSLLELQYNANKEILECHAKNKQDAIATFKALRPDLNLDNTGYAKHGAENSQVWQGHKSFCVAESFT